jgi:hypothetical protein
MTADRGAFTFAWPERPKFRFTRLKSEVSAIDFETKCPEKRGIEASI